MMPVNVDSTAVYSPALSKLNMHVSVGHWCIKILLWLCEFINTNSEIIAGEIHNL